MFGPLEARSISGSVHKRLGPLEVFFLSDLFQNQVSNRIIIKHD